MNRFLLLILVVSPSVMLAQTDAPATLRAKVLVVSAEWMERVPPTGPVNAPEVLTSVYPGQRIALALTAKGTDRERLLAKQQGTARVSTTGAVNDESTFALSARAVRAIKPQGGDMIRAVLKAGLLDDKELARLDENSSLVSMVVLTPVWTVPADPESSPLRIHVDLEGESAATILEPLSLPIRTTAEWLAEPLLAMDEVGGAMKRHHVDPAPGQVLAWFRGAVRGGGLRAPSVRVLFATQFAHQASTRLAAVAAYPDLDPEVQMALLAAFRLGGLEPATLIPGLPEETLKRLERIQAVPDPRPRLQFADPVTPEQVKQLGNMMDLGWSAWMATGDPSYLRALVELLGHPQDFAALEAWKASKSGEKGMTASVAYGLGYQVAGWSVGSFLRSDPLVADWLDFWEQDPDVPETVRKEIKGLATNPIFRREK